MGLPVCRNRGSPPGSRPGFRSLNRKDLKDLKDFTEGTKMRIEFFEVLVVFAVQLSGHPTCRFLPKFRNRGQNDGPREK